VKVPVFVKPKTSRLYAYRGARAIVCNTKEAGHYVGHTLSDENPWKKPGGKLLPHFGCAAVVITRGEKGMSIFEEDSPRHLYIPATSFEVTYARVGRPGIERSATRPPGVRPNWSGRHGAECAVAGHRRRRVFARSSAAC